MLFKNYKEFIKLARSQISCIEDFALMGRKFPIRIFLDMTSSSLLNGGKMLNK